MLVTFLKRVTNSWHFNQQPFNRTFNYLLELKQVRIMLNLRTIEFFPT